VLTKRVTAPALLPGSPGVPAADRTVNIDLMADSGDGVAGYDGRVPCLGCGKLHRVRAGVPALDLPDDREVDGGPDQQLHNAGQEREGLDREGNQDNPGDGQSRRCQEPGVKAAARCYGRLCGPCLVAGRQAPGLFLPRVAGA